MQMRGKSVPAKLISNVTNTLSRASSDGDGNGVSMMGGGGGRGSKTHLTCENLAHISKVPRHSVQGLWDPKFVVPSSVDWKIRDVENDDTMFYLILPANFKKQVADAQVFSMERDGRRVSYRSLDDAMGGDTNRGGMNSPSRNSVDGQSQSTASSSNTRASVFKRHPFKRTMTNGQEVVYMFRVLLDGNEKFIWLQAAAELGRLSDESALNLLSTTVDVTKKLFVLPMAVGAGRSNLTALRYAEWARLIDQKKNVSKFDFNVTDVDHLQTNERSPQDGGESNGASISLDASGNGGKYNSTRLVKVIPTYAYRNRRMTEKDLYNEMTTMSDKWEDFRGQVVGDREDEMIGCVHAEVLACHGLPKLDKLSSTDAVCYFVCGPYAFASDVIDGFLSPVWPSKSRRACIFPLFHAYQKLFVGVFDDDGAGQQDDFAGRVVVDVSRLRPNSVYDIFLPLRMYQNTYINKPRGVIHLRVRVEWHDERKALLSYLKRPKKTKQLDNAITVNCADYKAFRNVVLTVQGKDVPGRYKQIIQKGLQREMKLYKIVMKTFMKEFMMDIVIYMNPSISLSVFFAWMHCVYMNSMAYVPVYLVAGIIAVLFRNYVKYGMDEEFNFGFTPITISEMIKVLLYGGPNTNYIKPIKVTRRVDAMKTTRNSRDELDENAEDVIHQSIFDDGVGSREFPMDGDHMEFPFSEAGRYVKASLAKACVDASALFQEDEEEVVKSGVFSSLRNKAKRSSGAIRLPKFRDDDEGDEEDEFGLLVKSTIPGESATNGQNGQPLEQEKYNRKESAATNQVVVPLVEKKVVDKPWKRVTDPRGLPEQDASVHVKARKTLKEELVHNKNLLHKHSMRMFDDRLFIVNEDDPGNTAGEELLNQQIGTNKHKNPMVSIMAEFIAPALEMLKVGLSVWRAGFNLFTWRDPFLTSLFLFGTAFLLIVLLIFPWRLFFFVIGFGAVGPQNWALRVVGKLPPKKKKKPSVADDASKKNDAKSKKNKALREEDSCNFQFHNHLATDAGKDVRDEKWGKSTTSVHRAVVPNSPLLSRRFYDWPPNPSLSKVDIYSKEKSVRWSVVSD